MLRLATLNICLSLISLASAPAASPLLELTVGETTFTGKSLGHDDEVCWIAELDGRVAEVSLQEVTSYRKVAAEFCGVKAIDLRSRLRREFGADWEVVSTSHYLVCAPRGRAQLFAQTFEDLYRSFRTYFSRRGFQLPQPAFPMIAVIYPTPAEFAANCKEDGVPFLPGLKGYYHRLTNRVSLFEGAGDRLVFTVPESTGGHGLAYRSGGFQPPKAGAPGGWKPPLRQRFKLPVALTSEGVMSPAEPWDASIQADLKDTIVHEATHQVAYNLGLHSRIGENPKWITEGLAMMFEAEGVRHNKSGTRPQDRLNSERFAWFSAYAQKGRRPKSLARFLMNDRMFQQAPLDAYAQSWALTFYLAETRSSQFTRFLTSFSNRPPMEPYEAEERLADFQDAFGDDIDRLEVAFLRFMDDLK